MNVDFEKNKKEILMGLVILIILVIFIFILSRRNNVNIANNVNTLNTANAVTIYTVNYEVMTDGSKVNTSGVVATDKKVGDILFEQSKIVFTNGASKLTAKVTNSGIPKDNLQCTVKFIANDGTTIAVSTVYIGTINTNETKYIDSYVTKDVSDARNLVYEIIE